MVLESSFRNQNISIFIYRPYIKTYTHTHSQRSKYKRKKSIFQKILQKIRKKKTFQNKKC